MLLENFLCYATHVESSFGFKRKWQNISTVCVKSDVRKGSLPDPVLEHFVMKDKCYYAVIDMLPRIDVQLRISVK